MYYLAQFIKPNPFILGFRKIFYKAIYFTFLDIVNCSLKIDNVRIYGEAFNQAQIQRIYAKEAEDKGLFVNY